MYLKSARVCPMSCNVSAEIQELRNGYMEPSRAVIPLSVLSLRLSRRCFSFSSHSNIVGSPWSCPSSTLMTGQTLSFSLKWAHKRNSIANLCFKIKHKGKKLDILFSILHVISSAQEKWVIKIYSDINA